MTVSVGPVKKIYQGNGLNRNWGIAFPLLDASHVTVWVEREDGGSELVDPSEYEVDLNALKVLYPLEPKPALENGKKIALIRKTPISQEIDIVQYGDFFPETIEGGLDRSILIDQELQEELDRSVKVPATVENPEEYGRGVINASNEAKVDADRAASAAASAAGYAGSAKAARDRAEAEGNKAVECANAAESAKNQAIIEAINALAAAERAESAASGIGGATDSVISVSGKYPSESGNVDLLPSDIGAASLDHLHSLQVLGAAPTDHTHTTQDIGAADANHSHTLQDLGAAPTVHNHEGQYAPIIHNHNESYIANVAISATDAGKVLTVKPEGNGFEVTEVSSNSGGMNYWESGEYSFTLDAFTIVTHGLDIQDPKKCFTDVWVKYVGPSGKLSYWNEGELALAASCNVGTSFALKPLIDETNIRLFSGRLGIHLLNPRNGGYSTLSATAGSTWSTENWRYIFRVWY